MSRPGDRLPRHRPHHPPEQHDFASEAASSRRASPTRSTSSCRTIATRRGVYDRIASIEMFEAVGETYWPVYLRPAARPPEARRHRRRAGHHHPDEPLRRLSQRVDFIQRYIFPGGMLPSPAICATLGEIAGCRLRRRARLRRSTTRARSPNGASASTPPGRRSRRSASTSASGASGSTTWPIARRASAPARSTSGR